MSRSRNVSSGPTPEPNVPKRHAACDECRQRKLKCSGETSGCSRCLRQNLYCHYSVQKPMGRPPKSRTRQDDEPTTTAAPGFYDYPGEGSGMEHTLPLTFPDTSAALDEAAMLSYPYSSYTVSQGLSVTSGPAYAEQGHGHSPGQLSTPHYPTPPDYSHMSGAGMFPPTASTAFPVASNLMPGPEAFPQTQSLSPCSCLSYMYLCLNSLSSISSFPPSSQTLSTLYTAARTARSVIYCEICPQAFNSGVQNLMLLGTLLSVIGDSWLKVTHMDAEQLGTNTLSPSFVASFPSDPNERQRKWKRWLRHVVRHGVIGSTNTPRVDAVQNESLESPNLLSLIEELENRQRQWHANPRPHQIEYRVGAPNQYHNHPPGSGAQTQDTEHLCIQIAGTARRVIDRFGFGDE
ncbi:hypothetical protein AJ79_02207 [Helicocarpus griseus UAMH5409]|uniref:Zn(2)-C6 fungal-type domain-containing protein n=1 Tax=Helicocarpus griseus UAMH5409 TaxID=1447875 RepID=A0A2B7Y2W6_9EURO|nr:hypothetical protein AJ79_02207 [Helicocarpus griseus UAMH5409]